MNSNYKGVRSLCIAPINEDGSIGEMQELGPLTDIKEVLVEPLPGFVKYKILGIDLGEEHVLSWTFNWCDPRKYKRLMKRKLRGLKPCRKGEW